MAFPIPSLPPVTSETLGKLHFWLTFIPLNIVFVGMLFAGWAGMHRRIYDHYVYEYLRHLQPLAALITHAALALGAAQLLFIVNVFKSRFARARAEANPWQVGTLEWTIPSPAPEHNYAVIPVVYRGPHEYHAPNGPKDRDWLGQAERVPGDPTPEARTAMTHPPLEAVEH